MYLHDLIPDVQVLLSLAPEELAYQLLRLATTRLSDNNQFVYIEGLRCADSQGNRTWGFGAEHEIAVQIATAEAWRWLELHLFIVPAQGIRIVGGIPAFVLGRRGRQALTEEKFADYRRAVALPRDMLHPAIVQTVWAALARGDFDVAVLYAFRTVEEAVREAGGYAPTDVGVDLMRMAFNPQSGPLTNSADPKPEREALAHLFSGAIGSYKNPYSHRTVVLKNPLEAQEMVLLASHLLRIVEVRKLLRGSGN